MKIFDVLPAATLALCVMAVLVAVQLMPFGKRMLLVRVEGDGRESAVMAAAKANAAFVSVPAPGFVVVFGDASKIRNALGLAVIWTGNAECSPSS